MRVCSIVGATPRGGHVMSQSVQAKRAVDGGLDCVSGMGDGQRCAVWLPGCVAWAQDDASTQSPVACSHGLALLALANGFPKEYSLRTTRGWQARHAIGARGPRRRRSRPKTKPAPSLRPCAASPVLELIEAASAARRRTGTPARLDSPHDTANDTSINTHSRQHPVLFSPPAPPLFLLRSRKRAPVQGRAPRRLSDRQAGKGLCKRATTERQRAQLECSLTLPYDLTSRLTPPRARRPPGPNIHHSLAPTAPQPWTTGAACRGASPCLSSNSSCPRPGLRI